MDLIDRIAAGENDPRTNLGKLTGWPVVWSKKKSLIAIPVPSQSGTLTYNGSSQTPSWSNYDSSKMDIGGTYQNQTNAGTYTATFTPKAGYQWTDGTTTTKSVTWTIGKAVISTVPSQSGSLTYNGSSQTPSWNNYDSSKLTIGGTTSGTNVNSYTATFTPKNNYCWSGGSTAAKSVSWSIGKKSIAIPSFSGNLTYTGYSQTASFSNYDSSYMTVSGNTGTNAGSYTATFSLKSTTNYQWRDGTTSSKSVSWTIDKAVISTVPSQNGTLTYSGSSQSPTWSNYDSNKLTIGGTTSGTNAGTYTATFTPKSNYCWSGGSTSAKSVTWVIKEPEAAGLIISGSNSLTVGKTSTYTAIVTDSSGNTIKHANTFQYSLSNSSIASVTSTAYNDGSGGGDSSYQIKIKANSSGTTTLTVSLSDKPSITKQKTITIS